MQKLVSNFSSSQHGNQEWEIHHNGTNGHHQVNGEANGHHQVNGEANGHHQVNGEANGHHQMNDKVNGHHQMNDKVNGYHQMNDKVNGYLQNKIWSDQEKSQMSSIVRDIEEANPDTLSMAILILGILIKTHPELNSIKQRVMDITELRSKDQPTRQLTDSLILDINKMIE